MSQNMHRWRAILWLCGERAEVHRSAIMQDFRDNEQKNSNGRLAAMLYFISAKFVMGYLCVKHYILYY